MPSVRGRTPRWTGTALGAERSREDVAVDGRDVDGEKKSKSRALRTSTERFS